MYFFLLCLGNPRYVEQEPAIPFFLLIWIIFRGVQLAFLPGDKEEKRLWTSFGVSEGMVGPNRAVGNRKVQSFQWRCQTRAHPPSNETAKH